MERETVEEYIKLLDEELRNIADVEYTVWKSYLLPENSEKYVTFDISEWTMEEKEMVLCDTLKGIHFYRFTFSNRESFAVGAFNEVVNALEGKNKIQIYKKAFGRFRSETLNFLNGVHLDFYHINNR